MTSAHRQRHAHDRALSDAAAYRHPAVVALDDRAHQRQPQAAAGNAARALPAIQLFPDQGDFGGRDARPRVGDLDDGKE